jgi:DNA-binding MarR family transcriptional regulator
MSGRNGGARAADIDAVRRFNRFYTRRIGVLDEGHLQSAYSLAEVRVLYELAQRGQTTAGELCKDLGLDAGYLSRILRRFTRERLLTRRRAAHDRRQTLLSLTVRGLRVFATLNAGASAQVGQLLAPLSASQKTALLDAMATIETLLGAAVLTSAAGTTRRPR